MAEETLRNQKLSSWNIGHDLFHRPSGGAKAERQSPNAAPAYHSNQ